MINNICVELEKGKSISIVCDDNNINQTLFRNFIKSNLFLGIEHSMKKMAKSDYKSWEETVLNVITGCSDCIPVNNFKVVLTDIVNKVLTVRERSF